MFYALFFSQILFIAVDVGRLTQKSVPIMWRFLRTLVQVSKTTVETDLKHPLVDQPSVSFFCLIFPLSLVFSFNPGTHSDKSCPVPEETQIGDRIITGTRWIKYL